MKTKILIARKKTRKYRAQPILKIKRIRTEPRQHIRQLLRSFIPLASLLKSQDTLDDDVKII